MLERFTLFLIEQWQLSSLFIGLLVALWVLESKRAGETVSPLIATRMINKEDAWVLDVRDPADFNQGHIAGATNIPFQNVKEQVDQVSQHQQQPVILVCKMGQHSGSIGKLLRDNGFTKIHRLAGGISSWSAERLPLVKS